jgi:hypothetical protein
MTGMARLHVRLRRPWLRELALVLAAYWLYSLVRNLAPRHRVEAVERARDIAGLERSLHVDLEHTLNAAVAARPWLAQVFDYYYAALHLAVTAALLVWLWRRRPDIYPALRRAWLATNGVALLCFWLYPLAPPRLVPGFVDTVATFHTWGSLGTPAVDRVSNQFAAMPSLHVGWAVWCAVAVSMATRRRWVRAVAWCHPALTVVVVLATANHFVLDAVGGLATAGLGFAVAWALSRVWPASVEEDPFVRRPRAASGPPVVLEHVLRSAGGIAHRPRQGADRPRIAGQHVARPAGGEHDGVAHPRRHQPGLGQDSGVARVE